VRTTLEAIGIVFVVSIGISSAPKVRSLYETSIEKSLNEFRVGLNVSESLMDGAETRFPPVQSRVEPRADGSVSHDDLAGEDDSDQEEDIRVGKSQLWRFTLKTVSPDEMRPQIVKALQELNIPTDTPGLGGTQVPGGIEFDLTLPQSAVPNIKRALQKLSPKSVENDEESEGPQTFSWYKVKSKKKLPDGKSQVVIWLSQPAH
jgi:hypothetical protein